MVALASPLEFNPIEMLLAATRERWLEVFVLCGLTVPRLSGGGAFPTA